MYNYNKYGEYMKNKLFVFDLDGTLLCRNKENSNLRKINT
jgi:phosphoserine phosphatase